MSLPVIYKLGNDMPDASREISRELTSCNSVVYLLRNLFARGVVPKKIETLNDAVAFLVTQIQEANYTEKENDTISQTFEKTLEEPLFEEDIRAPVGFLEGVKSLGRKTVAAVKQPKSSILQAFKRRINTRVFEKEKQVFENLLLEKNRGFLRNRAQAILATLFAKIDIDKKRRMEENKEKCILKNFDSRVVSNCKLGFFENDDGCCKPFSDKIIFSSNAPYSPAFNADVERFEEHFLNITYEGYSVKEAVLITNIVAFLQQDIWNSVREVLDDMARIRLNPNRAAYGNLNCKKLLEKTKEIDTGNKGRTAASGIKSLTKLAIGMSLFTARAVAVGATRVMASAARKTVFSNMRVETDGDLLAATLITNTDLIFKIALSVYDEFVKLILKRMIKKNIFAGYTYASGNPFETPNLHDSKGASIKSFLLSKLRGQSHETVASFINLNTTDHSFEDFEEELVVSINTLGESVAAAFQTIPGLDAISNVAIKKTTAFIQNTCIQASLALQYNNNLVAWIQNSNIEFHLMAISGVFKSVQPQVYRKLKNITDNAEWRKLLNSKDLSIENYKFRQPNENRKTDEARNETTKSSKDTSSSPATFSSEQKYDDSESIGVDSEVESPTIDLGGSKQKRYRTKRTALVCKSKKTRSKSVKKRSRSNKHRVVKK